MAATAPVMLGRPWRQRLLLALAAGIAALTLLAALAMALVADIPAARLLGTALLLAAFLVLAAVLAWPQLQGWVASMVGLHDGLASGAPFDALRQAPMVHTTDPPAAATPTAAGPAVLQQALQRAEQASRSKSQFLTTLSHEIRTPMNGVMGLLQLLAGTSLDSHQRNYLALMQRSASGLMGLLDELLDFSRIEAGELQLQPRAVPLRLLLDEAAATVHAQALDRGLLLEVLMAPDLPLQVQADPVRLRQVVLHLLRNALKFTEVGQVLLAVRPVGGAIEISVSDTGPGIAPALQPMVFTPFVQGDDSLARRQGGVGLGLAVVAHLVQAMGGQVALDSQPGRGACFTVTLRLPVLAGPPVHQGTSLEVVVVSDATATRQALHDRLRHLGHEEIGAYSWRELAAQPEVLARLRPQAVLFDEPLAGWPAQLGALLVPPAGDDGRPSWRPVLVQRRPGGRPPGGPGCLLLARPLSDAELARTLESAAHGGAPQEPRTAATSNARGARVLLVEDDEVSQLVAHQLLEQMGCLVEVTGDAEAALQALREADFGAVLMDCQLPGLDGYEATRRIREGEAGPRAQRTPVIALTAHASAADRDQCLAAGMNDYLCKPVEAAELRSTVERWLPPRRD